eukprot:TRINITY_DN3355_c0_g1_i3.p1 TRINITY_DN3355_c0_g1~~TRINITY_DN3355_c0_g1_i3.p1  ORF type:complete len:146 (+),score=24.31 TRINITY_DN3355_c0_g1_i3:122-559(+)
MADRVELPDAEWRQRLTAQEYEVLRNKGTERAFTGEYEKFQPSEGYFACRGCGQPLYTAASKFHSGCGWPAFDKFIKGAVKPPDGEDWSWYMEILCSRCDGHLGHVFHGENLTETNERHCVNSVSVKYHPGPLPVTEQECTLRLT